MLKASAGQRLLGFLAKVPLFLVVEELLSVEHPLGGTVLAKLEERPPSDGTLVDLLKLVAKEIKALPRSPLMVFHCLRDFMSDTQHLDAMVTARNRLHHEPYDQDGFLGTVTERSRSVMEALRGALHGHRFLVPQHGKVLEGRKLIVVEDACSTEAHFRTIELPTSLPLESFPSQELVVWQPSPERVLKLGTLLTSKLVTRQSRDFGIFDRLQKNKRHFTFLRSE